MTDRNTKKIIPLNVKPGHIMAFVNYVKVTGVSPDGNKLQVTDLDHGQPITISGKELVENAFSADWYAEEVKVSKTEAAEILISSPNRPLTVCFIKSDGSERVLKGRLVKPEPLLGRSMVEDLEKADTKNRLRQVDHRTLQFVIVDGYKYVVK